MGIEVDDELGGEGDGEGVVERAIERSQMCHGALGGRHARAVLCVEDADDEIL